MPKVAQTYTPSEQAILDVLADGLGHTLDELHRAILKHAVDSDAPKDRVHLHLRAVRQKLQEVDEVIICNKVRGVLWYQQMLLKTAREVSNSELHEIRASLARALRILDSRISISA